MPMICSSVNLDHFMVQSSPWAGLPYQMEELPGVTGLPKVVKDRIVHAPL
jgi:hypothetical protein